MRSRSSMNEMSQDPEWIVLVRRRHKLKAEAEAGKANERAIARAGEN